MSLSERLAGPFNVETTIEPISIKISDAIMNFQESGFQVGQILRYGTGSNFPLLNYVYPWCGRRNTLRNVHRMYNLVFYVEPVMYGRAVKINFIVHGVL